MWVLIYASADPLTLGSYLDQNEGRINEFEEHSRAIIPPDSKLRGVVLLHPMIVHGYPTSVNMRITSSSDESAESIVVRDCLGYQLVPTQ